MESVDEDIGFAVYPRTDCPHVEQFFQPIDESFPSIDLPCSICGHSPENWLCLICYKIFCSRYVNQHGLEHFQQSGHPICISFSDLSFWCHLCEDYIESDEFSEVYSELHKAKFGVYPGEAEASMEDIIDVRHVLLKEKENIDPLRWRVEGLEEKHLENPVINKILGCIYGTALGDAFGLATEFLNKSDIETIYGDQIIPFPNFQRNFHNMRWKLGDWTDDTDQMILILDTFLEGKGKLNEKVFANKLERWVTSGFEELGDVVGMGLGTTIGKVVHRNDFLANPHEAAKQVWEELDRNAASNGAIMRTSIIGCIDFKDISKVIENSIKMCLVTHYDPRCISSCLAITTLISLMLQDWPTASIGNLQELIDKSLSYCQIPSQYKEEFNKYVVREYTAESLHMLQLDETSSIGYTLKTMGAGFWGLLSNQDFKTTLQQLIKEGGDADSNGAVCGALLGTKLGFSQLPKDWLNALPHKKWLDEKIVSFLEQSGLL